MGLAAGLDAAKLLIPRCTVCKALALLAEPDRGALVLAIEDRALSISRISLVCGDNGVVVGRGALYAHRSGLCPKP